MARTNRLVARRSARAEREERAPRRTREAREPVRARAAVKPRRAARVKRERPAVTEGLHPIRDVLSRTEKYDMILESADISDRAREALRRSDVKALHEAYLDIVKRSIMPRSVGKFVETGLFMIFTKKKPARKQEAIKRGTLVKNVFTGETAPHAGRPAKIIPAKMIVRLRPQRVLKEAVLGN